MKDSKIIERIRKLYAMSQDTSSANEAAIAAKRARSLMDKHGIQLADLESSEMSQATASNQYKQLPRWYGVLAFGVAKYNDCIVHNIGGRIRFSGYDVDVAGATLMLDYLVNTMERHLKAHKHATGLTSRAESSSFRSGFTGDMQSRLFTLTDERQAEQKAQAQATADAASTGGTALVLTDEKVKNVVAKFGTQRVKHSRASVRSASGYNAGVNASQRTNISRQVSGSGQRALR